MLLLCSYLIFISETKIRTSSVIACDISAVIVLVHIYLTAPALPILIIGIISAEVAVLRSFFFISVEKISPFFMWEGKGRSEKSNLQAC